MLDHNYYPTKEVEVNSFFYLCSVNQGNKHSQIGSIDEILERWWGYNSFRPMQREIIESILGGRDTLALMPTGGGKSLTFQVPALAVEGLTIVITPLIALMKDQVDALRSRGISALTIHSGMDQHRIELALDNCTFGDVKLLYVSPERIATEAFRQRLKRMNVSFVVVDEAHCISQWGYDFRPSYLRIAEIREFIPNATFLALTASATELVAKDIMHHLGFAQEHILRASFARPNLSYVVRKDGNKYEQLMRVLRSVEGSGIIYAHTRELCEELCAKLKSDNIIASFYHAGLPVLERSIRQDEWRENKIRVMVATNAFGMGIDKSDVRFVVHYSMCDTLEAYYQEAGRAGRDGRRSYALLIYDDNDISRSRRLLESEYPPIEDIKHIYDRISNYLQIPIGDAQGASFVFNIHDFALRERIFPGRVRSALALLEQNGYMTLIEAHDEPAKMMFECSRDALYSVHAGGNDMDLMLRTILRKYDGLFTRFRTINELEIAAEAGLSAERVHELMKVLWRMRVIRYIPANNSPLIYFDSERLPTKDIYIAPSTYTRRQELMRQRFESMVEYITSSDKCRSQIIEHYFGDSEAKPCGVCDVCLRKRNSASSATTLNELIISHLSQGELDIKELTARLSVAPERVVAVVSKMVADEKIIMSEFGKLKINS